MESAPGRAEAAEEEGVSGPDGSEEGRWEEVVRTQKVRKQRQSEWGKGRKCRKDEQSKRKRQKRMGLSHQTGRRQSRRREGNIKESEMNEEGCEKGERARRGIRGRQSSVGNVL